VNFFLGSFGSNIVLPTCNITERAQKPMVQSGGGSDLIFTQGRRFVFGIFPRASRQFYTFRNFFNELGKIKTFTIVTTNDPYAKWMADGTKKTLEDSGYQMLDYHQLPAEVSDVSSILASVRNKTPDVLLATTHDQISMLIAKQMVTTNTYVKMLYFALGPYTKAFRETLGKYANDIVTPIYWDENAAYEGSIFGKAKNFADYYRKNFKRDLTYHMASAAACIAAYVHAIQNADSLDPVKVRDALAALDVMSFYGRLKFTPDGDAVAEYLGPLVAQVQDLKIELLYPAAAATSKLVFPMRPWDKH
jgi:branched-chain amino acid transport system substrate-binding protein